MVFGIGLLPILVWPSTFTPILDGKLFLTTMFIAVTLLVSALLVLRLGSMSVPASGSLVAAWLVVLTAFVSAGLSGDIRDSLTDFSGSLYTAATIAIGMTVLTISVIIGQQKNTVMWLIGALGFSSVTLVLWHAARLLTGLDLSFGFFPAQTTSPLGGWNDVAILATGLMIGLLLTTGQGLLNWWQRLVGLVVLVAAIFVAMVIHNLVLWSILGVLSLSIVVVAITRRTSQRTPQLIASNNRQHGWLLAFAGLVFVATFTVWLGGDTLQQTLTETTNSGFVEVRPSVSASLDVVRSVWSADALTGVGPARYVDAWRIHKAPSINETIFWNTNFSSGHNFVLTQAATTGVLGLVAWLLFFGAIIVSGFRTFVTTSQTYRDPSFSFALLTYVLALYTWFTFFVTNPGVPLFIIASSLTGLYIGLSFGIQNRHVVSVSLLNNQKLGFLVVSTLVVLVIGVIWCLQQVTEQVIANAQFNKTIAESSVSDLSVISEKIAASFAVHQTDDVALTAAVLGINTMQSLLLIEEPTVSQQQDFQQATIQAVNFSDAAVQLDPTEPENRYAQIQLYALLAQANVDGAFERATAALDTVSSLDPRNPRIPLLRAELALVNADTDSARSALTEAIRTKTNYTPALYLLAQLEIAENNVTEAIAVTESILSFEPQNAARWYQLGVLHEANQNPLTAITALTQAIQLDEDFANALYVRGLLYAQQGDAVAAERDFNRVLALNPGNEAVETQLRALETGTTATSSEEAVLEQLDESSLPTEASVSEAAAETELITTSTNTSAANDVVTDIE
jgi:tetratricopeptide (TPR) repeat protein